MLILRPVRHQPLPGADVPNEIRVGPDAYTVPLTVTLLIEAEPFEMLNDADMVRHLLPCEARELAAALIHFADRAELS